jgi:hypothetical protein
MPRFEQRDKDGTLTEVFVIDEQTLRDDPEALLKSRGPVKSKAPAAPEGYELIATMENDSDALVSDCVVHYYAKKGSYSKEKPSKLSGLKAVIAEAEARAEAVETGAAPTV